MTIVFVVIHIFHKPTQDCYYLLKNKPSMTALHGKLVGWGGKMEPQDNDLLEACKRELKEELDLDVDTSKLNYKAVMYQQDADHIIHFYRLDLDERLEERYIEEEGEAVYKSSHYHKEHPQEFPYNNIILMDTICDDKSFLEVEVKDGKVRLRE